MIQLDDNLPRDCHSGTYTHSRADRARDELDEPGAICQKVFGPTQSLCYWRPWKNGRGHVPEKSCHDIWRSFRAERFLKQLVELGGMAGER